MKFKVTLSISVAIHALFLAWIIFIVPTQKEDSPIEITLGMYQLKKPGEVMKGHQLPSQPKVVKKSVLPQKQLPAPVPEKTEVASNQAAEAGSGTSSGPTSQDVGDGGDGGGVDTPLARYVKKVRDMIVKNHHYPKRARYLNQYGLVVLKITIDQTGKIKKIKIEKAPPYKILIDASKDTINEIGTFPPIPAEVLLQELTLNVPFNYKLED